MTKVYKTNVVEALQELTDYAFQKKAWLASSGPVVSSFMEDICILFDDTGLGHAFDQGEVVFGKDIDQALRELRDAIHKVDQRLPPQILLDNPLVQIVREKAAHVLKLIKKGA
jgi:hypothetical protein